MWDPSRYRQFGAERSRPFYELVGRIGATEPGFVADLGCGPGELTADLCERWPTARGARRGQLGRDDRGGGATCRRPAGREPPEAAVRAGRRVRLGAGSSRRRHRVQRDAAVAARTREVAAAMGRAIWRRAAGSRSRFPATSIEPTHSLLRELAALPRWRELLCGRGVQPAGRRSGRVPGPARSRGMRGRRLGDDLPARARGRGPGAALVSGHWPAARDRGAR